MDEAGEDKEEVEGEKTKMRRKTKERKAPEMRQRKKKPLGVKV